MHTVKLSICVFFFFLMAGILRAAQADGNPLFDAIDNGDEELVEALLGDSSININNPRPAGTVLSYAFQAYDKQRRILSKIAQNGRIDIECLDKGGNTILHRLAFRNSPVDLVDLLKPNPNFNVNKQNNEGETALVIALRSGSAAVALKLLEQPRIDCYQPSCKQETPLAIAQYWIKNRGCFHGTDLDQWHEIVRIINDRVKSDFVAIQNCFKTKGEGLQQNLATMTMDFFRVTKED